MPLRQAVIIGRIIEYVRYLLDDETSHLKRLDRHGHFHTMQSRVVLSCNTLMIDNAEHAARLECPHHIAKEELYSFAATVVEVVQVQCRDRCVGLQANIEAADFGKYRLNIPKTLGASGDACFGAVPAAHRIERYNRSITADRG